ncbi:MAG: DUF6788 family protein [Candidatus Methylomirabilales bacterium]
MAGRAHLPLRERHAVSRLHLLLRQPGILHGSLHRVVHRCGKESCHCAEGKGHPAHLLQVIEGGRQRSVYVPAAWVGRVQEWIERDRDLRALLLEISSLYVARLRGRRE